MRKPDTEKIGFYAVVAIGIGGMVGGGIFAVLGLAVQFARGSTPIAFLLAGLVALITSHSYARLSVTYPCQGGTVEFVNQAFGTGIFTGSVNILLWISYIIMLSLYAYAFGSYGASFLSPSVQQIVKHLLLSIGIVIITLLNTFGSAIVGEAEEWIVGFKIVILLLFIALGLWSIDYHRISLSEWAPITQLVSGGMIIFVAYEGFELIANTAGEVKNPSSVLPRAYYTSVVFVIILYVLVALVTVGNLPFSKIIAARDYALAESARPFLGSFGFTLIAIAAILSTGSAINATLYGTARVSYVIAKDGELPLILERKIWQRPLEGLFITSFLTLLVANFFDLARISMMGSAGFLLIFAAVNAANLRLYKKTGGNRWLSALGVLACFSALAILIWQRAESDFKEIILLVIMVLLSIVIETAYRYIKKREIRPVFKDT